MPQTMIVSKKQAPPNMKGFDIPGETVLSLDDYAAILRQKDFENIQWSLRRRLGRIIARLEPHFKIDMSTGLQGFGIHIDKLLYPLTDESLAVKRSEIGSLGEVQKNLDTIIRLVKDECGQVKAETEPEENGHKARVADRIGKELEKFKYNLNKWQTSTEDSRKFLDAADKAENKIAAIIQTLPEDIRGQLPLSTIDAAEILLIQLSARPGKNIQELDQDSVMAALKILIDPFFQKKSENSDKLPVKDYHAEALRGKTKNFLDSYLEYIDKGTETFASRFYADFDRHNFQDTANSQNVLPAFMEHFLSIIASGGQNLLEFLGAIFETHMLKQPYIDAFLSYLNEKVKVMEDEPRSSTDNIKVQIPLGIASSVRVLRLNYLILALEHWKEYLAKFGEEGGKKLLNDMYINEVNFHTITEFENLPVLANDTTLQDLIRLQTLVPGYDAAKFLTDEMSLNLVQNAVVEFMLGEFLKKA